MCGGKDRRVLLQYFAETAVKFSMAWVAANTILCSELLRLTSQLPDTEGGEGLVAPWKKKLALEFTSNKVQLCC